MARMSPSMAYFLRRRKTRPGGLLAGGGGAVTPTPAHLYDFTGGSLPAGVTASGGDNRTRVNSSGALVAGTAPRFDYTSGAAFRGLLAEVARTNLILQSANLGTTWSFGNATALVDQTISPSGSVDADKLTETNVNDIHRAFQTITITSGTTYTLSIYVKDNDRRYMSLSLNQVSSASIYAYAEFDLTALSVLRTGQTGAGAVFTSSGIEDAGNNWRRIWLTGSLTTTSAYVFVSLNDNSAIAPISRGSVAYLGTGKSVFLFGGQFEAGTAPSTYIPTTTASVAATADLITVNTPATFTTLRLTFDNDATQDVTVTPSSTYALVPASMTRPRVKYIDTV